MLFEREPAEKYSYVEFTLIYRAVISKDSFKVTENALKPFGSGIESCIRLWILGPET